MRQAGIYSGILSGKTGPHSLPLSRIKKIMKQSGEEVKMISCEAPLVFSRACELFIEELTVRAYKVTVQGKRRTLQKDDIAAAVSSTDIFDFLMQIVSDAAAVVHAGEEGEGRGPVNIRESAFGVVIKD